MEEYTTLIETAAKLIANTLYAEHRDSLLSSGPKVDRLILDLVRAIGRQSVELVFSDFAASFLAESDDYVSRVDEGHFCTVLGVVPVVLCRLRDRVTRTQTTPLSELFGVVRGGKSEAVRRALTDFGSEHSYGKAVKHFHEHYGIEIGRTSALRVVTSEGERAVDFVEAKLDEQASEYDSPTAIRTAAAEVFVELDGSMLRTATQQPAGYVGRSDVPRDKMVRVVEWREVRVGLAYKRGEATPTYVAARASYPQICDQLFRLSVGHGLGPQTTVIASGDGGNGLKDGLHECFSNLRFILDHPHFAQHVWSVAHEQQPDSPEQYVDAILDDVWAGNAEQVLARLKDQLLVQQRAAMRIDVAPELRKFADYLDEFIDAVDYAEFVKAGWPIGSGRIESSHKQIPQARMKIPGASWHPDTLNKMLALRVIRANDWWDEFWSQPVAA